ncbi:LuxR family transcriptional regulator [Cryobacterium roopkundense]|uniref:DNA-binding NarL/FixJ family response regulator n=1 Tax=Cryobacterium roopkundense TaxID=1001240 RepID=A0A099J0Y7_9MICO|nr:response regulator transcription factor [Cryobacterium roopkundense]KGJ71931.1 LuxR family transcriptional regulator [Cryobacterium roopkundense]MBB5640556.1 DNA-binding NarL/FixJ family response regulator [Cryobacterium roopkundense]
MTDPIRVALVDDQALFRAGLRLLISSQPDLECVGEAGNGADGIRMVAEARPDVVLMDIRMPVMNGIEATTRIVDASIAADGGPRIIVLTTFDLDEAAARAIRGGASGFVLKDADPEFLLAAVRTVHAGASVIAAAQIIELFESFGTKRMPAAPPAAYTRLTPREQEIFALAARGLSNAEIAAAEFLSEATVKTHISRTLTKLDLRDRVQLVVYAYENSLIA